MTKRNGHDTNFHNLHLTDKGIRHAKLIEFFISQTSPDTYYLLRYSIPKFPWGHIMVDVLLHWCCEARINMHRKLGCGAVMQPFLKDSLHIPDYDGVCS